MDLNLRSAASQLCSTGRATWPPFDSVFPPVHGDSCKPAVHMCVVSMKWVNLLKNLVLGMQKLYFNWWVLYCVNYTCSLKASTAVKTCINVEVAVYFSLVFLPIFYKPPNSISVWGLHVSNQSSDRQPQSLCPFRVSLCHHSFDKIPKSCPTAHQAQITKYDAQGTHNMVSAVVRVAIHLIPPSSRSSPRSSLTSAILEWHFLCLPMPCMHIYISPQLLFLWP